MTTDGPATPYDEILKCWQARLASEGSGWRDANALVVERIERRRRQWLSDPPGHDILFFRCEAGWLNVLFALGQQWAELEATNLDDPFPSLVKWAERLVAGETETRVEIDEEGTFFIIETARVLDGTVFRVLYRNVPPWFPDGKDEVRIEGLVDLPALARSFYRELRRFVAEDFSLEEWAGAPVKDMLTDRIPGFSVESLDALSIEELHAFAKEYIPREYWSESWFAQNSYQVRWWIREALEEDTLGYDGTNLRRLVSDVLEHHAVAAGPHSP